MLNPAEHHIDIASFITLLVSVFCTVSMTSTCIIVVNYKHPFYPNVTTLRSGLCYRKSVCCLSSV